MQYEIIILGVIISTLFGELTGISPGGVVVPAYIALYLHDPKKIVYTIFISLITVIIVKSLSNYMILYGRRKFTICIVVSFLVGIIIKYINIKFFDINGFYMIDGRSIGIIISGILANELLKNGIIKTLSSLFIVAIVINSISELFKG